MKYNRIYTIILEQMPHLVHKIVETAPETTEFCQHILSLLEDPLEYKPVSEWMLSSSSKEEKLSLRTPPLDLAGSPPCLQVAENKDLNTLEEESSQTPSENGLSAKQLSDLK